MKELLRWENVLFLMPLGVGIALLLVSLVGAGDHDGHDADLDHAIDVHHDTDAHVEGSHPGIFLGLLAFFGGDRAPLSVVFLCATVAWAVSGLLGNQFLGYGGIQITIVVAAVATFFGTRVLARLVGRLVPKFESYSESGHYLWGQQGDALFPINDKSGTVRLRNRFGTLIDGDARTLPGIDPIMKGERVVIEEYDEIRAVYFVRPLDDSELGELENFHTNA